jgi:hypothetical protein
MFDRYNIVNDRDLIGAATKLEHHFARVGILSGIPSDHKALDQKTGASPIPSW